MLFCLLHLFMHCLINPILDAYIGDGSFWAIQFVIFFLVSLSNVIDFLYTLILLPI